MTESSTRSDSTDEPTIDELLEEPTVCPDCGAGLQRAEDDEAVTLDCPKCDAKIVYPK